METDHRVISVPEWNQRARSSAGRARRLQRRGLGFKSPRVHWCKIFDAPGLATDLGKGLRPRKTGAMIRCVKEMQRDITRRFWTLHGFEETTYDVAFTPVSGWLGSGADEGRAKLR